MFSLHSLYSAALCIFLTSLWVHADAKALGVQKGYLRGFFDRTPGQWVVGCLVCWSLVFPAYLAVRLAYQRIARGPNSPQFATTTCAPGPTINLAELLGYVLGAMALATLVIGVKGLLLSLFIQS